MSSRAALRRISGIRRAASPMATAGLLMIAALAVFCFAGPLFYHADLVHVNLLHGNRPPAPGHPLGTDGNGMDVLGLLMAGGQLSLEVGAAAGLLAAMIGSAWGAVAGYVGGPVHPVPMPVFHAAGPVPTPFLPPPLPPLHTP